MVLFRAVRACQRSLDCGYQLACGGFRCFECRPIRIRNSERVHRGIHVTWIKREKPRSEEHTSELQSRLHLVCRLLLEKKKKNLILDDKDKNSRRKTSEDCAPTDNDAQDT